MKEENIAESKKIEIKPEDKPLTAQESSMPTNEENNVVAKKKPKKLWYKNPWFWVGLIAAIVGVVSITLGLIYRSNVIKTNQAISDGWVDITTQANQVVVLQNRLSQTKDYNAYSIQLHSMDTSINNRKVSASKLPGWLNNTAELNRYNDFLNRYSSYIGKSASLSDDPSKISTDDISALTDSSKTAQTAAEILKNNSSFLQTQMPEDIYKIPQTLQDVSDVLANKQKASEVEKQAASNAAAQDVTNQQAVTTSVNTFQNGFIAGNANAMRPVMTAGFQNEYNFNLLNPDNRQYQYPASFRIITVVKQPDGTYKAQVNVLYKYRDNPNQYTQGLEYSVILSSSKWLLNNEKQTNSF